MYSYMIGKCLSKSLYPIYARYEDANAMIRAFFAERVKGYEVDVYRLVYNPTKREYEQYIIYSNNYLWSALVRNHIAALTDMGVDFVLPCDGGIIL